MEELSRQDQIGENRKRVKQQFDNVINSWRKILEKDNGPNGPTNIDLMDSIFIQRLPWDSVGEETYREYTIWIYKSTKATSITKTGIASGDTSKVNGIKGHGQSLMGHDPYYRIQIKMNIDTGGVLANEITNVSAYSWWYEANRSTGEQYGSEQYKQPILLYSSNMPISNFPEFVGVKGINPDIDEMLRLILPAFPLIKDKKKTFDNCNKLGLPSFKYVTGTNNKTNPKYKQYCCTFLNAPHPKGQKNILYVGNGEGKNGWTKEKEYGYNQHDGFPKYDTWDTAQGEPEVYTNNYGEYAKLTSTSYKYPKAHVHYITHPIQIPKEHGGGYMCNGQPWVDDDGPIDSELSGPIKDLLEANKKTFYLLGKKGEKEEPKLYLFDLGQVGGVLTYTHIKEAIVYKQQSCNWIMDSPNKQDLKLSSLEGEVDTNFYLLTPDKIDQPSKITKITLRQANDYLLKYFPTCKVNRPIDGVNPDDNLKPDFGGGSGGGGGNGGIGGGGFFPENNNPLPNPEVPPCSGEDGGSQTPVSEIWLLSVPELTPSYDDTYDFSSKEAQHNFFLSKKSFGVSRYSYLRKENAIQVGSHVDNLKCYNYLMYKNKADKWYYCFIMDKQYINERTARIVIATDVIQTYLFDYKVGPCYVERCHVDRWTSNGIATNEVEPEGLEFGEHIQHSTKDLTDYTFSKTFLAVCSNPLGEIPSRAKKKAEEKGVDENGL